jgi:hypothetical protein
MAEEIDLNDAILRNAAGPKRVTGDSGSVEQHSLGEQLEAARFLKSAAAAAAAASGNVGLGIRHVKLIPPGHD